ncbi:MAG: SBBP repeat-containing protein [Pirellulales bacterium]
MQHHVSTFVRVTFFWPDTTKTAASMLAMWLTLCCTCGVFGQTFDWVEQFGTSGNDGGHSISADGLGNLFISGITYGSLDGPNAGETDVFLRKYDSDGVIQWGRQLGTSSRETSISMSADGLGSVYLAGYTYGDLGASNAGLYDGFLAKYDDNGVLQWSRQFGTVDNDAPTSISTDGLGNIYVAGQTEGSLDGPNAGDFDAFLRKYNADGVLQWGRQFGTDETENQLRVSADDLGNVFITGVTKADLNGPHVGGDDVFLRNYNSDGIFQWGLQFGTNDIDLVRGISADDQGNVYVTGNTNGSLDGNNVEYDDVFLRKYDDNGVLQWGRQIGTPEFDYGRGVSTDSLGNVFVSGSTTGDLGPLNAGGGDAFLILYDANGDIQWTTQFGTSDADSGQAVSADGLGGVYVSGQTTGSLAGENAGNFDAFLAHITNVPLTPGDANGDGKVNGLDYLVWAENFDDNPADDPPGSPANGDFNDDGRVDGLDYLVWAENFEAGPNDGATVPEPGASALAMLACAMATWNGSSYRRRRRG